MKSNKFQCQWCLEYFTKYRYNKHVCKLNEQNLICHICDKKYSRLRDCTSHIINKHGKEFVKKREYIPLNDNDKKYQIPIERIEKIRSKAIARNLAKHENLIQQNKCKSCNSMFEVSSLHRYTRLKGRCPSCVENKRRSPLSKEHREKISRKMSGLTKSPNCGIGRGRKGSHQGIWCDSSWELAWVLYNKELGTNFRRNTKYFEYEFEGRKLKYFPDFVIIDSSGNEQFIEIKGFTDKKFIKKEEQLGSMIMILRRNEMQPILDWTIEKYGINFINQYDDKDSIAKKKIKKERKVHVKTTSICYNDFVEAINVAKHPSW